MNTGGWWWTGKPGVLWFMGSQRIGHNWVTELTGKGNWPAYNIEYFTSLHSVASCARSGVSNLWPVGQNWPAPSSSMADKLRMFFTSLKVWGEGGGKKKNISMAHQNYMKFKFPCPWVKLKAALICVYYPQRGLVAGTQPTRSAFIPLHYCSKSNASRDDVIITRRSSRYCHSLFLF